MYIAIYSGLSSSLPRPEKGVPAGLLPPVPPADASRPADFRTNDYRMCKIGKLSFVAGAELPNRYVVA